MYTKVFQKDEPISKSDLGTRIAANFIREEGSGITIILLTILLYLCHPECGHDPLDNNSVVLIAHTFTIQTTSGNDNILMYYNILCIHI